MALVPPPQGQDWTQWLDHARSVHSGLSSLFLGQTDMVPVLLPVPSTPVPGPLVREVSAVISLLRGDLERAEAELATARARLSQQARWVGSAEPTVIAEL